MSNLGSKSWIYVIELPADQQVAKSTMSLIGLRLFADRWNLWPHLPFYHTQRDRYGGVILDGTNNHCERSIGWWIKERYSAMRGYKRNQSALNLSRLLTSLLAII